MPIATQPICQRPHRRDADALCDGEAAAGTRDHAARDGTATEADASLVKLHASEAALECQLNAFRVHGGKGLEAGSGNCEELIDVLSSLTYSGTSDLQKVILAASLGLQT